MLPVSTQWVGGQETAVTIGSPRQSSRALALFAVLLIASAAAAAYAAVELAVIGRQTDPFGDWPWVYDVVPMSFLFVITHPLMTATPITLWILFTVILFLAALILSRPLRRGRYRFFDRASLWFFGVGIPTFIIADRVVIIPDPYLNLVAALVVAWAVVGVLVLLARRILAGRAVAGPTGEG